MSVQRHLGYNGNSYSSNNNSTGMTKTFNDQYYLDVIGTSYCRSRAIACTKDEYETNLNDGELQKVMLYLNTKHGLIQFKNNAIN